MTLDDALHDADCPMTNSDPADRVGCICDGPLADGREAIRDTPVGGFDPDETTDVAIALGVATLAFVIAVVAFVLSVIALI